MHRLLRFGLFVGCLAACGKPKQTAQTTPPKPQPIRQVVGIARIEPERGLLTVYAGAAGRVVARAVAENESVAEEQTLLALDPATDNAQVAQALARLATQQAAVAAQEAGLASLKLDWDNAVADADLNRKLLAVKGTTEQTLRDSEANADKQRQAYRKGQADLTQTRTKLAELRADLTYYRTVAGQKTVRSPYPGTLLEWSVTPGDYVTAGMAVAQLAPAGPLTARTEVDELFAERVRVGQRADVRSQSTGKPVGSGVVYFTAGFLKKKSLFADETAQEDRRVREVRIRLNPGAEVLINGRVDCIIHL